MSDDYSKLVQDFARRGRLAREAHLDMHDAFRAGLRSHDRDGYRRLVDDMFALTNAAMPPNCAEFLLDLKAGSPRAIDVATAFLQADAYFFRSGYLKAAIIRRLKKAPLTGEQKRRLQGIVIERVKGPDRREFPAYCQLALAVRSPGLEEEVERMTADADPGVRRRARWMMLRFASAPAQKTRT